ncbi:11009_t:CDS:2, partial [Acaulospora colombiana]
ELMVERIKILAKREEAEEEALERVRKSRWEYKERFEREHARTLFRGELEPGQLVLRDGLSFEIGEFVEREALEAEEDDDDEETSDKKANEEEEGGNEKEKKNGIESNERGNDEEVSDERESDNEEEKQKKNEEKDNERGGEERDEREYEEGMVDDWGDEGRRGHGSTCSRYDEQVDENGTQDVDDKQELDQHQQSYPGERRTTHLIRPRRRFLGIDSRVLGRPRAEHLQAVVDLSTSTSRTPWLAYNRERSGVSMGDQDQRLPSVSQLQPALAVGQAPKLILKRVADGDEDTKPTNEALALARGYIRKKPHPFLATPRGGR